MGHAALDTLRPKEHTGALASLPVVATAAAATLVGYGTDFNRSLHPPLISETVAFLISLVAFASPWQRAGSSGEFARNCTFTVIASAILFLILQYNGDTLNIATLGALKWVIFFLTCFFTLRIPKAAFYTSAWIVGFTFGLMAHRLLAGQPLHQIAKYTAPPLYVLLTFLLATNGIRTIGFVRALVIAFTAVAAYGALAGGYRGSALGTGLLVLAMAAGYIELSARLLHHFRRPATLLLSLATAALPALFVILVPLDQLAQSTHATKSNIERTASLTLALNQIKDSPLTGHGVSGSFLELRKIFANRLAGFDATSSVHNQALDFALFGGIPMGVAFAALYGAVFSTMISLAPPGVAHGTKPIRRYSRLGSVAALSGIASVAALMAVTPFTGATRCFALLCTAAIAMRAGEHHLKPTET